MLMVAEVYDCGKECKIIESTVEAGSIIVKKPITKAWGKVVAHIRDIDRFLLEICTPMV
jgi:hypothetical protein